MTWTRRGLAALAALVGGLLLVLVGRALTLPSHQLTRAAGDTVQVDAERVARHLSAAVRFRTVWLQDRSNTEPFEAQQAWLAETYPAVHRTLALERIDGHSLLFTWRGSDPSLKPALLAAHQDVVPVEPGTESDWTHPPWSGAVVDGVVWGRGTMDDKASMVTILEAVEALIQSGFRPSRTLYLALGHDEEVSGEGAQAIARRLEDQRLSLVLDEGLVIATGILPGLQQPAALIGITERGYMSLDLVVNGQGGHSSMPPPQSPIGILGAAIARVEANPMPGAVDGPIGATFRWIAPEMRFPERLLFANTWLFEPILVSVLSGKPTTNASIRTTIAPTVFQAGDKENVLAQQAHAVLNMRVHPRDTVDAAEAWVRAVIDDPRVEVSRRDAMTSDPSPLSTTGGPGFAAVQRAVHATFPEAVVAPGMMLGATDARFYTGLSDSVYRFQPLQLGPGESSRFHGTDEQIRVDNLEDYVRFYATLVLELEPGR
ncbi:MAG: carboxypeptidase PM20D1 [Myxococcota bacterium]|jgi:carboxypeptidase PM20D1